MIKDYEQAVIDFTKLMDYWKRNGAKVEISDIYNAEEDIIEMNNNFYILHKSSDDHFIHYELIHFTIYPYVEKTTGLCIYKDKLMNEYFRKTEIMNGNYPLETESESVEYEDFNMKLNEFKNLCDYFVEFKE